MSKPTIITDLQQAEAYAEELKKEHGTVYIVAVPKTDNEGKHDILFCKKPSRAVIKRITPLLAQQDLVTVTELVLKNTLIEGPESLFADDDFVIASMTIIEQMIVSRQAILKKK
ncbi:MAG: hypothetical protein AAF587_29630 [Bacteroidota bacterium]